MTTLWVAWSGSQVVIDNMVFIVSPGGVATGRWDGVSWPCGGGGGRVQVIVRASGEVDGTR